MTIRRFSLFSEIRAIYLPRVTVDSKDRKVREPFQATFITLAQFT